MKFCVPGCPGCIPPWIPSEQGDLMIVDCPDHGEVVTRNEIAARLDWFRGALRRRACEAKLP